MSETRELISEDDRPMFERNSRDKFILTYALAVLDNRVKPSTACIKETILLL